MIRHLGTCLIGVAVFGSLAVHSGDARADAVWSGAALDGQWSNPGNWVGGTLPAPGAGNTILNDQTYGSLITIDSATSASVDGDIFGPEFGMDLDIVGGSLTQTYPNGFVFAPVGTSEAGRSVINLSAGAHLTVHNLLLGDNWWFQAPFVTMNVDDAATMVTVTDWVWLGGHLNLYNGTIDVAGGFNMAANAAAYGTDKTRLDIHDGTLIIRGANYGGDVTNWIASGYLTAYGGAGVIQLDTTTIPGGTILTAIIPEPNSLFLLGCAATWLIVRQRAMR